MFWKHPGWTGIGEKKHVLLCETPIILLWFVIELANFITDVSVSHTIFLVTCRIIDVEVCIKGQIHKTGWDQPRDITLFLHMIQFGKNKIFHETHFFLTRKLYLLNYMGKMLIFKSYITSIREVSLRKLKTLALKS